jgi:hypothetical protein
VLSASINEPHSFPVAGIWHVIVLGHRGRSDAICWHVLPQHRLPIPLRPANNRSRKRAARTFAASSRVHTRLGWKNAAVLVCASQKGARGIVEHPMPHPPPPIVKMSRSLVPKTTPGKSFAADVLFPCTSLSAFCPQHRRQAVSVVCLQGRVQIHQPGSHRRNRGACERLQLSFHRKHVVCFSTGQTC